MGLSVSYFRDWNDHALQQKYDEEGGALVIEEDDADVDKELEIRIKNQEERQKYAKITRDCTNMMSGYEWIDAKVEKVWLAAVNSDKKLDMRYVLESADPLETHVGDVQVLWYPANARFKVMQCIAKERVQDGNTFTCITNDGERLEFMVGYTVKGSLSNLTKYGKFVGYATSNTESYYLLLKSGRSRKWGVPKKSVSAFIIQDENVFDAEQRYMSWKHKNISEKVKDILNKPNVQSELQEAGE